MADTKQAYHVDKGKTDSSVLKIAGQGHLAEEFLKAAKDFETALGKCVFRDEAQKNAVCIYKAHLEMFDMVTEIEDLVNWLNGTCAIGGLNRSAAIMDDTGIYTPAGLGIKGGKDNEKAIKELREERNKAGRNGNNERF
jgi:hypothetical protein